MRNRELLRTNTLICLILILGFSITAFFGYKANYQSSLNNIEQVSALTTESIYYQLTTIFTKPVNISLTMAHDSLLVDHLSKENEHLDDQEYVEAIQTYLDAYRSKYGFDSVFLVSSATKRYYNFDGIDRVLERGNPENEWYYNLMDSSLEYSMNVDNDEVHGSGNAITVFVNCKILDGSGEILGIVGVGIKVDYLNDFLKSYEDKYKLNTYLVNEDGVIEISTAYTGYSNTDWFDVAGQETMREQLLSWKEAGENLSVWSDTKGGMEGCYIVSRYIPELSWHLVVCQDNQEVMRSMSLQLCQSIVIILVIIVTVLLIITTVIRKFSRQIADLTKERQRAFTEATEQLYDDIYELNITRNSYANQKTAQYFESLGAKNLPYDRGLAVIAEKQIQEEFRKGYVGTFSPENVKREYERGNYQLRYDFMMTKDGTHYFWMRIDAYVFLSQADNCLHMFTYRKNIDDDKKKAQLADLDETTGMLTKTATRRRVSYLLSENNGGLYAFFIFDIDNFKQVNDSFGHAFGDFCIKRFAEIIRGQFRDSDVLGRIGGDEFAAFIPISDMERVKKKAEELLLALNTDCTDRENTWRLSTSIGISVAPMDGDDFDTLYVKADKALYQAKEHGKSCFCISSEEKIHVGENNTTIL